MQRAEFRQHRANYNQRRVHRIPDLERWNRPEAVVANRLPKLSVLWTAIDTYGCPQNAAVLRKVINELREAVQRAISTGAMEFVVQDLFRVSRARVAGLLSLVLHDGINAPYKIVDFQRPPTFGFRSDQKFILRELDYPLNEGGSLSVVRGEVNAEARRLDPDSIAEGLNVNPTAFETPSGQNRRR